MIWFNLLIPLIAMAFVSYKFTSQIHPWEYVALFGIPTLIIIFGNFISISSQTFSSEYWNSYAIEARYYEPWDEEITTTVTDYDSKGNPKGSHTETHTEYHSAQYELYDNCGNEHYIESYKFTYLCNFWNNRTFKDMNRDYDNKDGDMYYTSYTNNFEKLIPLCSSHSYKNKVKASKSVFNFQVVDEATKKDYQLYDYPPCDTFNFNPILGYNSPEASRLLQKYNALYGKSKQIHMMVLIFQDKPYDAGVMQENLWKGGNKNEFILCIGLSKNKIKWTKVISWTESDTLKFKVAREVKNMDFNILEIVKYLGKEVPPSFVRKQFKDFDYLNVQPTDKAIMITFILTLLATIIISIVIVRNDYNLTNYRRW